MDIQLNVPKLRFAGFDGEWNPHKLSEVFEVLESGVSVNSIDTPAASEKELGVLKTSCVSSGKFFPEENKTIIAEDVNRARLNPFADAILISRMNTPQLVGECGLIDKNYPNLFVPDRLWQGRVNKLLFNPKLVSLLLASENFRFRLTSIATGTSGSMKNISQPNFLGLDLTLPTLPEQQKIASFLTKVDEKLTQLKKKKELLEQYKKGMMQKIFSQEIRFKDDNGEEFPEWEEKKLADIISNKSPKFNPKKGGDLVRCIELEHLSSGNGQLLGYIDARNSNSIKNQFYEGAVLFGKLRPYLRKFLLAPFDGVCSSEIWVLNGKSVLNLFLFYLVQTNTFIDLANQSSGSKMPRADWNVVENGLMVVPSSFTEQTKIAHFLSKIDKKISLTQTQIDKAEQWKNGLLQQMFI
jgi:type I restriction enzyme S subunit